MKWVLTIRQRAEIDLQEAHDWDEEQSPGLGDEFLADMASSLSRLEAQPELVPLYYQDFRRVLAHRFPYKIFFRIIDSNLIVFRILHAAQNHPRRLNQ